MNRIEAKQAWREQVYDNEDIKDVQGRIGWVMLCLGFFIGRGFTLEEARTLVMEVTVEVGYRE